MDCNVSARDAAVRALLGTVLAIFAMDAFVFYAGVTGRITGTVLLVVSTTLVITAVLRTCPIYYVVGRRALPA